MGCRGPSGTTGVFRHLTARSDGPWPIGVLLAQEPQDILDGVHIRSRDGLRFLCAIGQDLVRIGGIGGEA
jgi:hypothetical protein